MSITDKENELVESFAIYDDWMEKYEYLIELGKELPLIDDKYKEKENLIIYSFPKILTKDKK